MVSERKNLNKSYKISFLFKAKSNFFFRRVELTLSIIFLEITTQQQNKKQTYVPNIYYILKNIEKDILRKLYKIYMYVNCQKV